MIVAEILDASGTALARVKRDGTCVVGTDRTCDLVLADSTVQPRHVELSEGTGGTVTLRRLAEQGDIRVGKLVVGDTAEVTLPATLNVGDVALRLSTAVPSNAPADASSPSSSRFRVAMAWGLCLAAVVLVAGEVFLTTYKAHPWQEALGVAVAALLSIQVWVGAWAVGNRLFGHRKRYIRHLTALSMWMLIAVSVEIVEGSIEEILHTEVIHFAVAVVELLLFAWLLYLHIRVASRWRRRTNAILAAAIVLAIGGLTLLPTDTDADGPVTAALTSLGALPAAFYVTRPAADVSASANKIFEKLKGMESEESAKAASDARGKEASSKN